MKKNILLVIFTLITCFICVNNVEAAWESGACLYMNEDDDRLIISYGGASVDLYILDSFQVTKKKTSKTIQKGTGIYVNNIYNQYKGGNSIGPEWLSSEGCKQYLIYTSTFGSDEAYSTNDITMKDKKYREVFYLKDSYQYPTPDNVTLKKLFCTYDTTIGLFSYDIEYDPETGNGRYRLYSDEIELWDKDFNESGINSSFEFLWVERRSTYFDNFDLRAFWDEETNSYSCPNGIYLDVQQVKENGDFDSTYTFSYGLTGSDTVGTFSPLAPQASYIDFKKNTDITGKLQQCIYSFEQSTCQKDDENCFKVSAPVSLGKDANGYRNFINTANYPNYQYGSTDVIYDFSRDYDFNTTAKCSVLPKIYTNCNQKGLKQCEITDKEKEGYDVLYEHTWANNHDSSDVEEQMGIYQGFEYIPLICDLKKTLLNYGDPDAIDSLPKLQIYTDANMVKGEYNIRDFPCSEYGFDDTQRCDEEYCKRNGQYTISMNAMEAKNYCQGIFKNYTSQYENSLYKGRVNECISFNNFYNSLVELGLIEDLTAGCDILSTDIQEKLGWILNLLKIAGPILALGLGTLDFIKAVASGDADKEMKTAFKRFSTRIAAAALLFVIPLILAFLMDTFLGNQAGYNEDNPFCNIVEWK